MNFGSGIVNSASSLVNGITAAVKPSTALVEASGWNLAKSTISWGKTAVPALVGAVNTGATRALERVGGVVDDIGTRLRGVNFADDTGAISFGGKADEATNTGVWSLPSEGGGLNIGGRWYTEHALERMAPNTPEVMARLETRAVARAQAEGLAPGTREFAIWWADGPKARGVLPSVVEAEIADPGTTGVRVITNANGDVVTVWPTG